ncbi:hypothetical protein MCERE85_01184 [Candidatus Nanopelagicaceae bacterium]
MESLAVFVAILFLMDVLSGPIAILLTWGKLVRFISSQSKNVVLVLTVIRRIVHGFLVTVGLFIGTWLAYIAVTPAKLFGLFSLITSYIALRREYFPDFHLLALVLNKVGIRKIAPGDHGPSMKWKRSGRSSGSDGHGPGGQH